MALGKRKFTTGRGLVVSGRKVSASYASRFKRAKDSGRTGYANIIRVGQQVRNLSRMIETKEGTQTSPSNVGLPHNNTYVVQSSGADLNPMALVLGTGDPMAFNTGARIGDRITIKGLMIRGFLENALSRPKVYYRIMLIKCPRGQAPTRANDLFKGSSNNKMIDQVNTEKFTIIWQKIMTIQAANNAPATVGLTGTVTAGTSAGIATRTFKAWIPGKKLCRGGYLTYENGTSLPKFFDYRLVILCYDWFGTPQDTNTVGQINELYTKLYFKDA